MTEKYKEIMSKADDAQAQALGWEVIYDPYEGNYINFGVHTDTEDIVGSREREFAKRLREGDPLHVKAALAVIFGEWEP